MKTCSRCHIEKGGGEFRLRYDKRGKGSQSVKYLNNTCKKCDAEISNKHYFKNKDNSDFRKKWVNKSKEYSRVHREEIAAKMKIKRQTPEYKAYMKEYREKRKAVIHEQEVITKKKYHEKNKNPITDKYVINQLKSQGAADFSQQAIEIKRSQILISRIREKINQHEVGKTKKCTGCNTEKDLSEFWLAKRGQDKRVSKCKECSSVKSKKYKNERHCKPTKPSV